VSGAGGALVGRLDVLVIVEEGRAEKLFRDLVGVPLGVLHVAAVKQDRVRQLVAQEALDPAVVGVVHLRRHCDTERAIVEVFAKGVGAGAGLSVTLAGLRVDSQGARQRGVLLLHAGKEGVEARLDAVGKGAGGALGGIQAGALELAVVVRVFGEVIKHDPADEHEVVPNGVGMFPLDAETLQELSAQVLGDFERGNDGADFRECQLARAWRIRVFLWGHGAS